MLDFFGLGLALSFPFGETHGEDIGETPFLSSQMSTKEPRASWGGRASEAGGGGMGELSRGQ